MNNQEIKINENKIIVENNQYEVNFKNNKLQICNKNTYNCNIIYEYTGNINNIVLLINKEGYLNITDKDTNNIVWSTNTLNIDNNKNNFFNITNDNEFILLITDDGDLQIINTITNNIKWSLLVTQAIYNSKTKVITQYTKQALNPTKTTEIINQYTNPTNYNRNTNINSLLKNNDYNILHSNNKDYNIGIMLKGIANKNNLNNFISKNKLLGNNLYISPYLYYNKNIKDNIISK